MRKMHKLIKDDAFKDWTELWKKWPKVMKNNIVLREMMANYTMDVIALSAFAIKIDTHNTGTTHKLHPFIENAQAFFRQNAKGCCILFLRQILCHHWWKRSAFQLFPKKTSTILSQPSVLFIYISLFMRNQLNNYLIIRSKQL